MAAFFRRFGRNSQEALGQKRLRGYLNIFPETFARSSLISIQQKVRRANGGLFNQFRDIQKRNYFFFSGNL